jgi:hypothetical protein
MPNKRFWIGMCALALTFGMMMIGCEPEPTYDADLNGTWTAPGFRGATDELKLNNGNFEQSDIRDGTKTPSAKGTYTTSGGKLTMKQTHYFNKDDSVWVSVNPDKADLKAEFDAMSNEEKAEILEEFGVTTFDQLWEFLVAEDTYT